MLNNNLYMVLKKITLPICSFFVGFLFSQSVVAQSATVFEKIQKSVATASVETLSPLLLEAVEIGWDETKKTYDRKQAKVVLREFFKKNPPSGFEYIHKGASKEGLQYGIGKYTSGNGFWRVYILVKEVKGSFLIDTMDFSKE